MTMTSTCAPPAEPVASHPPEEENSPLQPEDPRRCAQSAPAPPNGNHCDPDQVALPWLRLDEGLSDELTAAVGHQGSLHCCLRQCADSQSRSRGRHSFGSWLCCEPSGIERLPPNRFGGTRC
jgi:hypothetical protein